MKSDTSFRFVIQPDAPVRQLHGSFDQLFLLLLTAVRVCNPLVHSHVYRGFGYTAWSEYLRPMYSQRVIAKELRYSPINFCRARGHGISRVCCGAVKSNKRKKRICH